MIVWVVYDITKNKARSRVSKICKQAGLYRVQNSVFSGSMENNEKDELKLMIEEWIDPENDSVYIFPMSKKELKQTVLMGQAFDKDLVTDKVKELFI